LLETLHCDHQSLKYACYYHNRWHPFSRSYGAILQSSLARVSLYALDFSSWTPVSVSGTGGYNSTFRSFSRQRGICTFVRRLRVTPHL